MPNRDGRHRKIIKNIPLISILIWLGLTIVLVSTVTAQFGLFFNYLPVVMKPYPTPTPTRTPTVTPTRTPTYTPLFLFFAMFIYTRHGMAQGYCADGTVYLTENHPVAYDDVVYKQ